jgi:hypothetical protein
MKLSLLYAVSMVPYKALSILEGFVVVHTFLSAIVHRESIGYQQLAAYTLVGKQCNQQNILPVWTFITLSTGLLRKMPQRKALTSHIPHQ